MPFMEEIKKQMLASEMVFSKHACYSKEAIRKLPMEEDIRPSFERDTDRIIHTLAYNRYADKTQVFSNEVNDNISHRMTHVQYVSRASRTIARALGLNEDLCEAIALGHDIGHTPFGHVGEAILDTISNRELNRHFTHNLNSVRVLMNLENGGHGCNLSLQVLDGILCHNGELVSHEYRPFTKNWDSFLTEYETCYTQVETIKKLRPMTLEGCIVRISDIIGYIGRDIEDAIALGRFNMSELPDTIKDFLGTSNRQIMNYFILDIIENSYQKDYISMSDTMYQTIVELKRFNQEHIYQKANTQEMIACYTDMFETLYTEYLTAIQQNTENHDIYETYLLNMTEEYRLHTKPAQIVIDFMAGMTDGYMKRQYEKYKIQGGTYHV